MGYRIRVRTAMINTSITQSSAAASTTQDGITIDRLAQGLRRYYSAKAVVSGAYLGNSSMATAYVGINVQHSSDGTSWDNYSTQTVPTAGTYLWGSTSGGINTTAGAAYGTVEQSVNLNGARRYIRIQVPSGVASADCSSGHAFTAHGVLIFGGADELPVDTAKQI
jgi:hypothetical protein